MSITFINEFQNQIFKILSTDSQISSKINKIYLGAVQDGKSPFILINIKKTEQLFLHVKHIYSIEFQISAYAKDNHHKLLTILADRIVTLLDGSEILFDDFKVAGMKARSVNFEKAKDLVLNKLCIDYKALIKRENDD
jgi:hypothetical protein